MRTVVLFCFLDVITAYRPYDLIQEANISEASYLKMQENMAKLSDIQKQLLITKGSGPMQPGRRPSTVGEEAPSFNLTSEVQSKPDQLPYLFEGDIVLNEQQMDEIVRNAEDQLWATVNQRPRKKRSMTSTLSLRWTFPIPYYINTATGVNEAAVLAGINKWQSDTCVTFTRLNYLPSTSALNFILGNGCYSYIGKQGTVQVVSIGYGCTSLGTVTHEIGHALGFYHEQARFDRDSYVTIVSQNIQNIYLSQFTKQSRSSMVNYGVGYDLGSVLHYDGFAFTSNQGETIKTVDPNYQMTIGQRVAPSFADVKRINMAYCNSSCTNTLDCLNGGYTNPKSCSQCRCPDGFGGTLCERADNAPASCGPGDLTATDQIQTIHATGALKCPYVITAPPGKKIFFQFGTFTFTYWTPCIVDYLEIKYGSEFVSTGARFCRNYPVNSLSETNRLVVIYEGSLNSKFSLDYRYDPADPIAGTTVGASTASTITTTTTTTTSPVQTTVQSSTSQSTSTTTMTFAQTTPNSIGSTSSPGNSTMRPSRKTTQQTRKITGETQSWITRRTWPPTTNIPPTWPTPTSQPRTWPSSTTSSETRTWPTSTNTATTKKLTQWTFFPQTSTQSPKCSAWTSCTALCGGCGMTTRRCNGVMETKHCNLQPCANEYCCMPFFFVSKGLCVKPYSDEELYAALAHSTDEEVEIIEGSGQKP